MTIDAEMPPGIGSDPAPPASAGHQGHSAGGLGRLPNNPLSPRMVPSVTGQLAQFLGRLQRLAHTQPELSAFNAQGVFQSKVRLCNFHNLGPKLLPGSWSFDNGEETYHPRALAFLA